MSAETRVTYHVSVTMPDSTHDRVVLHDAIQQLTESHGHDVSINYEEREL